MPALNAPRLPERSPTPPKVYEPRLWKGRVWVKGGPIAGYGFRFKAPYGVYMNALELLGRAMARGQILRFQMGPITPAELRDRAMVAALTRYEPAFELLGLQLGIDWSA